MFYEYDYDLEIFILFTSSESDLYKDTIISSIIKENGKAATISRFCRAVKPSADNKITAIEDCAIPQTTFTIFDGFKEPFVVCIPRTNVAESADVIKKVLINMTAIIYNTIDKGNSLKTANNVSSVFNPVKSVTFC